MKKNLSFAIIAMAILGLGSLTSCHDEDFGASTAVLQERAFEQGFFKEFGKPSADQTWDFYAAQMEAIRNGASKTRATMDVTPSHRSIPQPTDDDFKALANSWTNSLEESNNNANVGQNSYTLTSTGTFKIYAVNYGGGIETQEKYNFKFGIVYIDSNNAPQEMELFHWGFEEGYPGETAYGYGFGNPGWGQEVTLPIGTRFYFYMTYTYDFGRAQGWDWIPNGRYHDQKYYSNATPTFFGYSNDHDDDITYSDFGGTSTLLYTTEDITEDHDEQIMMIGIEDAWGLNGRRYTQNYLDYDYNDIVLLIEGELPVSENKRFFAEDKKSFDWDYNDVVFDVSNTGIVLRAVGGTLPVWLKITDKKGTVTYTDELHKLLLSKQHQAIHKNHKLTFEREVMENGIKVKKTFYKPIDVASNPGLWLDPEPIVRWTIEDGTRLDITAEGVDEVELFANPFVAKKSGDVELIVGSDYEETLEEALERIAAVEAETPGANRWLDSDANDYRTKIIRFPENGGVPAIWSATTNVRWMKELQKITLGYENFYGGGDVVNGVPQWWKSGLHDDYWYQFVGDVDPDAQ